MTAGRRPPPPPPQPVRTPTVLLITAAGIGSIAVVALIGSTVGHASTPTVHTTTAAPAADTSTPLAWTPPAVMPYAAPVMTVTARTTEIRYRYTPATVTAYRTPAAVTRTVTATATVTATTTAKTTATTTTTVTATATVTQTVAAPTTGVAP